MRSVKLYKPSESGKGSAVQFHPARVGSKKEPALFVEAVRQSGPKPQPGSSDSPFNWKDKISIMLSVDELANIVAYIKNLTNKEIKFVHRSEKNDKESIGVLGLKKPETAEEIKFGNWLMTVGRDRDNIMVRLTPGEVMQLAIISEEVIRCYIDVQNVNYEKS
jgi:hypothetical protein